MPEIETDWKSSSPEKSARIAVAEDVVDAADGASAPGLRV